MTITIADLDAMCDVLGDLAENADTYDVEAGLATRQALEQVGAAVRLAIDFVDMHLVTVLESPREFGGVLYEVGNKGKWRPNHGTIKGIVKKHALDGLPREAINPETGEVIEVHLAADRAIELMYLMFVAKATFPKQGALDSLETVDDDGEPRPLDKPDVGEWKGADEKKIKTTQVVPK